MFTWSVWSLCTYVQAKYRTLVYYWWQFTRSNSSASDVSTVARLWLRRLSHCRNPYKKSLLMLSLFGSLSAVAGIWYLLARCQVLCSVCSRPAVMRNLVIGQLVLWWWAFIPRHHLYPNSNLLSLFSAPTILPHSRRRGQVWHRHRFCRVEQMDIVCLARRVPFPSVFHVLAHGSQGMKCRTNCVTEGGQQIFIFAISIGYGIPILN